MCECVYVSVCFVCVCVLKRNISMRSKPWNFSSGAKGCGLYGDLGLAAFYFTWKLPRHLDELVCDLCWGGKMSFSYTRTSEFKPVGSRIPCSNSALPEFHKTSSLSFSSFFNPLPHRVSISRWSVRQSLDLHGPLCKGQACLYHMRGNLLRACGHTGYNLGTDWTGSLAAR